MSPRRKTSWTLTLCLLSMTGAARAQHPGDAVCSATSVPSIVRAEGLADVQADIVAICTVPSDTPTDITVQLNVNVTNNRDFLVHSAPTTTDAVLIINEDTTVPMYGALTADNTLQWSGVVLPSGFLTVRITNIRANPYQLGFPPLFPSWVTALISFTGVPVYNNPLNISMPLRGLAAGLQPGQPGESFRIRLSEGFPTAFNQSFAAAISRLPI